MRSSSWPILFGILALIVGAAWFDATQSAEASAGGELHATANAMK